MANLRRTWPEWSDSWGILLESVVFDCLLKVCGSPYILLQFKKLKAKDLLGLDRPDEVMMLAYAILVGARYLVLTNFKQMRFSDLNVSVDARILTRELVELLRHERTTRIQSHEYVTRYDELTVLRKPTSLGNHW